MSFSFNELRDVVAGKAAALRCITEYQPAGGPGDKVFPPTYEGGKYAIETRVVDGDPVDCVILDSVQSQANRNELALLEACRAGQLSLPLLVAKFDDESLLKRFTVTSLDAPHRAADAIFRDCTLDGTIFRKSGKGRVLDAADVRNATGLFGLNPTALVFGLWDSTGPRGGLGAKFQRALVSEMVGYGAVGGVTTGSRVDPTEILKGAAVLYARKEASNSAPHWTLNKDEGSGKLGKDGKPSEANLGNVTPDLVHRKDRNNNVIYEEPVGTVGFDVEISGGKKKHFFIADKQRRPINKGGFTITKAVQTTVLSLAALRRLRFPLNGSADSDRSVDIAARTALAAIGLTSATMAREEGADLRSRCQLVPTEAFVWELLDRPGQDPKRFELTGDGALTLCKEAIEAAKVAGLPWDGEIALQPSDELLELISRSQKLAAADAGEAD